MWAFFSRRLRRWLLLAIALPLTRALVHRLALAAERRDPSTRTVKALHQADTRSPPYPGGRPARQNADPLPRTSGWEVADALADGLLGKLDERRTG